MLARRFIKSKKTVKVSRPVTISKPPASVVPLEPVRNAFNANPLFEAFIERLLNVYEIKACIETGTFNGGSTLWFAKHLPEVHTIEINKDYFNGNKSIFATMPSIRAHLGNSPVVMQELLKTWPHEKRCVFYLDAHWGDYWPIHDELLQISKSSCRDNCMIVIDDFQVPNRPDIPFDNYHGHALNIAFIEKQLKEALPNLHFEYYAPPPELRLSRGRLIAFPKHWINDS